MSHSTEDLQRFRKALGAEDVEAAMRVAGGLPYVGIGDALDLVRLLARKRDPRFDRAANRWLARFIAERGASLGQAQVATAAMGALALDPDDERAVRLLRGALDG